MTGLGLSVALLGVYVWGMFIGYSLGRRSMR